MLDLTDSTIFLYLLPLIPILIIVALLVRSIMHTDREKSDTPPVENRPEEQTEPPCISDTENVSEIPAATADGLESEKHTMAHGISLLNEGRLDQAELCLQSVLDDAAASRDMAMQCEARYYLAKVNKEMGDLTLACEHWQIARELYQESGDTVKIAEIEKYMRENGCPTDWVLNGF